MSGESNAFVNAMSQLSGAMLNAGVMQNQYNLESQRQNRVFQQQKDMARFNSDEEIRRETMRTEQQIRLKAKALGIPNADTAPLDQIAPLVNQKEMEQAVKQTGAIETAKLEADSAADRKAKAISVARYLKFDPTYKEGTAPTAEQLALAADRQQADLAANQLKMAGEDHERIALRLEDLVRKSDKGQEIYPESDKINDENMKMFSQKYLDPLTKLDMKKPQDVAQANQIYLQAVSEIKYKQMLPESMLPVDFKTPEEKAKFGKTLVEFVRDHPYVYTTVEDPRYMPTFMSETEIAKTRALRGDFGSNVLLQKTAQDLSKLEEDIRDAGKVLGDMIPGSTRNGIRTAIEVGHAYASGKFATRDEAVAAARPRFEAYEASDKAAAGTLNADGSTSWVRDGSKVTAGPLEVTGVVADPKSLPPPTGTGTTAAPPAPVKPQSIEERGGLLRVMSDWPGDAVLGAEKLAGKALRGTAGFFGGSDARARMSKVLDTAEGVQTALTTGYTGNNSPAPAPTTEPLKSWVPPSTPTTRPQNTNDLSQQVNYLKATAGKEDPKVRLYYLTQYLNKASAMGVQPDADLAKEFLSMGNQGNSSGLYNFGATR